MGVEAFERRAASFFANRAAREVELGRLAPDELAPLSGFGLTIENSWDDGTRKKKVFDALSLWNEECVEPYRENAVLVDTTTLATVKALTQGSVTAVELQVTPGILYDLCAFINSVVLFDTVFHLEASHVDTAALNQAISPADPPLRQLPIRSFDGEAASAENPIIGVGGALTSLMWNARGEVNSWRKGETNASREARDTVAAAWTQATGFPVRVDQFADGRFMDHGFSSDGPQLLRQALDVQQLPTDAEVRDRMSTSYITESTVRSVFNTGVSEMIGVGYAASSARLPFRRYWLDLQGAMRRQLLEAQLDVSLREAATKTVDRVELELPFFTAAVLGRIKEPSELLRAIGDLREEAAGFRALRAELEAAIDQRNDKVIVELKRAVNQESKNLLAALAVPAFAAAVAIVTAPATLAQSLWIPAMALLAGYKQLDGSNRELLKRRLTKRHLCFLTKTADQSRCLLNALPVVEKLWPISAWVPRKEFPPIFDSLARLGES